MAPLAAPVTIGLTKDQSKLDTIELRIPKELFNAALVKTSRAPGNASTELAAPATCKSII